MEVGIDEMYAMKVGTEANRWDYFSMIATCRLTIVPALSSILEAGLVKDPCFSYEFVACSAHL